MKWYIFIIISTLTGISADAQIRRTIYQDEDKSQIKEVYYVKDTITNILEGKYISYYINGHVESEGQFVNNETIGEWKFYYETGKLRMIGDIERNSNDGFWKYYYESGIKSMEGKIIDQRRSGEWKIYYENGLLKEKGVFANNKRKGIWITYFEDGEVKSETDHDTGEHTEYYPTGEVKAKGEKSGTKSVGVWTYFHKSGLQQAEGRYDKGKRIEVWTFYHENGAVSATGNYASGEAAGEWVYYHENGEVSSKGTFLKGKKSGYWGIFYDDGAQKGEVVFDEGVGEYKEYYKSGKLKMTGKVINEKNEGDWKYYYETGELEGEAEFKNGRGAYTGYYPNGSMQTKGIIEDNQKIGRWELYKEDGSLSGYYKPIYNDPVADKQVESDSVKEGKTAKDEKADEKNKNYGVGAYMFNKKKFNYFKSSKNEFQGLILSTNPLATFIGRLPVALEFYMQERIGHEFEFEGIRRPFYKNDFDIPLGETFTRGYSVSIRQKFYNRTPSDYAIWYFGHELKFVNEGHFANIRTIDFPDNVIRANAIEERLEYMLLLGYRLMQSVFSRGFTVNIFVGGGIAFRGFDNDPNFPETFEQLDQSTVDFAYTLGLHLGYVFSFDNRR